MLEGFTLAALVDDALKGIGLKSAGALVGALLKRRREAARVILLEEIRHGRANALLDALDADEVVAILLRYLRAAEEGTARLNLRLMASVLAGQIETGELHADAFLRWSGLLASLTKMEIIVLATLHRSSDEQTRAELVGRSLASDQDYELIAQALVRTGLLQQIALVGWSEVPYLGGRYQTSPWMTELARIIDLDGALRREGNID